MKPLFTNDQIKKLFPFHIVINGHLEILQTGKLINRLLSINLKNEALLEHFVIEGITGELSFDSLLQSCDKLVYLKSLKGKIVLKGAFYESADREQLIFFGNIQPKYLLQHHKKKVKLKDIPAYDSFHDFLFSYRANTKAYEELQFMLKKSVDEIRLTKSLTEDIRESERRYHDFIEHSQEGIWRMDFTPPLVIKAPTGKLAKQLLYKGEIVECNDVMAKMYGYKNAKQFHGKRLIDMYDPATNGDRKRALQRVVNFIQNDFRDKEIVSKENTKKGELLHMSNSTVGHIENGKLGILWGVQRNVTKQVLAQLALKESEEKYQDLYDHAPDMFFSFDVATKTIIKCNHALNKTLGYLKKEIIGKSYLKLYHPDSRQTVEELTQTLISKGKISNPELRLKKKDGSTMFVSLNASATYEGDGRIVTNCIWRDITEKKKAEETLLNSEDRYRSLVENMNDGMMQVDNDETIKYVNHQFCELLGYKRKELIGQNARALLSVSCVKRSVKGEKGLVARMKCRSGRKAEKSFG